MDARRFNIADGGTQVLGPAQDGVEGYWLVQITAVTGTPALVPQGSLDGTNWVARKFSPIDGSADVASVAAAGLWLVKGSCPLRLSCTGGTVTGYALPVIGG